MRMLHVWKSSIIHMRTYRRRGRWMRRWTKMRGSLRGYLKDDKMLSTAWNAPHTHDSEKTVKCKYSNRHHGLLSSLVLCNFGRKSSKSITKGGQTKKRRTIHTCLPLHLKNNMNMKDSCDPSRGLIIATHPVSHMRVNMASSFNQSNHQHHYPHHCIFIINIITTWVPALSCPLLLGLSYKLSSSKLPFILSAQICIDCKLLEIYTFCIRCEFGPTSLSSIGILICSPLTVQVCNLSSWMVKRVL